MTVRASTIRPGFLVSLKTNVSGNVRYFTTTIEGEHITDGGAQKARWETERLITDPAEHEAAIRCRSKVRTLLSAVCSFSSFGLLCPEAKGEELLTAIVEARKVADDFNAKASYSSVSVAVLIGKIAQDDAEAVRAINSEVAELLANVNQGLKDFDVKLIRDNANRAKELAAMLSDGAAKKVETAIEAARSAARKIASAQKSGETKGLTVDQQTIRAITEQRTAFLELDGADEVEAPDATTRALDFAPVEPAAPIVQRPASIDF